MILKEDLTGVDDPIAHSIQDRVKAGGNLSATVKEADLKKHGIKNPKPAAHKVKASAQLQDFVDPSSSGKSESTPKTSGIGGGVGVSPNKRNI